MPSPLLNSACVKKRSHNIIVGAAPSVLGPSGFDPIPLLADTFPVFSKKNVREDGVKDSPARMVVLVDVAGDMWDSPFKKEKPQRGKERKSDAALQCYKAPPLPAGVEGRTWLS